MLAALAAVAAGARGASLLTADTMRAALRTANPNEEAYITYVATLLEQGRLPREMVEGAFQWARRTPYPKRVQYFKHALIRQAAAVGITLPEGTPSLTGTIKGRVLTRVLLVSVPVPGVTVTIDGTKRTAVTDAKGAFTFSNVPLGTYTLRASGVAGLLARSATAQAMLPSRPPSSEPLSIDLEAK